MNRRSFLKTFAIGMLALAAVSQVNVNKRKKPKKIKPVGKWVQKDPITGKTAESPVALA